MPTRRSKQAVFRSASEDTPVGQLELEQFLAPFQVGYVG